MAKVSVNEALCKGCALCVGVCPKGVLALEEKLNARGYHPAVAVEPEACIGCAACGMMCPDCAIVVER